LYMDSNPKGYGFLVERIPMKCDLSVFFSFRCIIFGRILLRMRYVSGKTVILKIAQLMRKYRDRQTVDDNINIVSFEVPYSKLCVNL